MPNPQLQYFRESLPETPYCVPDGVYSRNARRDAEHAVKCAQIQPNHYNSRIWLIYDIDRATCVDELVDDLHLPTPQLFVQNPKNQHAHVFYRLETPIHQNRTSSAKAIRYADNIELAYSYKMRSDPGYNGLLAKNPLHPRHTTTAIDCPAYSLGELAEYVDLAIAKNAPKAEYVTGEGRNVDLFDSLRYWAYRAIRQGWPDYDQWRVACLHRAQGINRQINNPPLGVAEVRSTALSVAKWVYRNYSPSGFSERQSYRGRLKGQKLRDELIPRVVEMRQAGHSQQTIADTLGIPRKTISDWLIKTGSTTKIQPLAEAISDSTPKGSALDPSGCTNPDRKTTAYLMHQSGHTQKQIAEHFDVSQQSVSKWIRKHKLINQHKADGESGCRQKTSAARKERKK